MEAELFPADIQAGISHNLARISELEAHWPRSIALGTGTEVTIYDYYPYVFRPYFAHLSDEILRDVTLAARLSANTLFLCDQITDQPLDALERTARTGRTLALQAEAYQLLYQHFPPHSPYWAAWRSYLGAYIDACIKERAIAAPGASWADYGEEEALAIAIGKNGVAKATIAALAELSQDATWAARLCESIDHYNVACQMYDDLLDWKQDLADAIPSLVLARIVSDPSAAPSHKELAKALYYDGHACAVLELALQALEQAEQLLADGPQSMWLQVIAKKKRSCAALLADIEQIVAKYRAQASQAPRQTLHLPVPETPWQALGWQTLAAIISHAQSGFAEAKHHMLFPWAAGFSGSSELQSGDVFQRALIADALYDCPPAILAQLAPILEREQAYLLAQRQDDSVGGWSYFPDLPELAPDADDLAQVMHVLLHAGRHDLIASLCTQPLSVLLNDATHPDGSFETWIIPAAGRSPRQERQAAMAATAWGRGADPDVMANLLFALYRYDPQRYAATISAGANYLAAQQLPDGSWRSTWYYGPFYGTFVCLRLLAALDGYTEPYARAAAFVRAQQHPDGGWGLDATSDALSTALALLGLAIAPNPSQRDLERAERGRAFLQAHATPAGDWAKSLFIRMDMARAHGGPEALLAYESRTLTAAYVLKAALAWDAVTKASQPSPHAGALQ